MFGVITITKSGGYNLLKEIIQIQKLKVHLCFNKTLVKIIPEVKTKMDELIQKGNPRTITIYSRIRYYWIKQIKFIK